VTFDQNHIDALNVAIQSVGGQWTAGQTPLTGLTSAEVSLWLGYVPGPGEPSLAEREAQAQTLHQQWLNQLDAMKLAPYPPRIDWRDVKGRNFVSPVEVQGNCGSCVAFAVAGAVDGRLRVWLDVAYNDPNTDRFKELSVAQLAFCGGQQGICGNGWHPSGALQYCTQTGLAPEASFPYTDHEQACNLGGDWETKLTRISGWAPVWSTDEMKRLLSEQYDGGPRPAAGADRRGRSSSE